MSALDAVTRVRGIEQAQHAVRQLHADIDMIGITLRVERYVLRKLAGKHEVELPIQNGGRR